MLILLRHGRTTANARGLLQGRVDNHLDDLGVRQAQAAAALIGPVDRVIASPLARAQQTAAAFGLPVETDDRWQEIAYGEWEEKPVADVPAETWAEWRANLGFRPPGGETLRELGKRVRTSLDEHAASAEDATVVIVSHVSPMKAACAWALGTGDEVTWNMHLAQAAICRIRIGGDRRVLASFNEQSHLAGLT